MGTASSVARARQALDAGRRARIVRHARLMPATEDDAAQMRFAVEDALHTADFADLGRLILVRRLRLADVPPRASAAWMSRAMESAWRAMALHALPAVHPSAARSDAVFFASRFEARIEWLARVARAEPVREWFWPMALPELKSVAAPQAEAAIQAVMECAWQESPTAIAAALHSWPDAQVVALARRLGAAMHGRLLALFVQPGMTKTGPPAELAAVRVRAAKAVTDERLRVAQRLARHMPLNDDVTEWIAALWTAPALGRLPLVDEVQAVVTRAVWLASESPGPVSEQGSRPAPTDSTRSAQPPAGQLAEDAPVHRVPGDEAMRRDGIEPRRAKADAPAAPWRVESGLKPSVSVRRSREALRRESSPALPWLADAAMTRCGGLMIVLNLLKALRFERWLADRPTDFVDALFLHLLDVCEAEEDDPQRTWFSSGGRSMEPGVRQDDTVSRMSSRRTPGSMGLASPPAVRPWRLHLRRTLRRRVGMDLRELVNRPAWVSATPTHIDVIFPLDQVDLRLRRRGLDSDPGWVPWFGRIVAFHFIDAELLPESEPRHG